MAAVSANAVWEVRPTNGSDTNGGGWVGGAAGTDYSQNNNKNASGCTNCGSSSVNLSVTDGVAAGTTTVVSATANFSSAIVGNVINISGGTGSITSGWYQVTAFTNSTTVVVDRATGLTAGTGATINIGGAFQTITQAGSVLVGGNKMFVKAEATISSTATITISTSTSPGNFTKLIGYTSNRTDAGKVTLQLSTNTGLTALAPTGNGIDISNFIIDCNTLGTSTGIATTSAYQTYHNIVVKNCTSAGVTGTNGATIIYNSEFTGMTSAAAGVVSITGIFLYNWVHDNQTTGIIGALPLIAYNLFSNNTGATSDGIQLANVFGNQVLGNTIYKSGRDGIRVNSGNAGIASYFLNNILDQNSGYGINFTAASPADPRWDGNAYYSNTSGTRHNMDDVTGVNSISPYTNIRDVTLTADPFVLPGSNNFTLNTASGGGAAIRGSGIPGIVGAGTLSQTGALGMGAFQFGTVTQGAPILQ